jgi:hypothetical protein
MQEEQALELHGEAPSTSKILRDWIFVIVVALGAAMLVRVFVLQQSMLFIYYDSSAANHNT